MAKAKSATWFKMFLHQKALIDSVPDDVAGKALKACFAYFDDGEIMELDNLTFAVFAAIKPYIDESLTDYQARVDDGKRGSNMRWRGA